MKALSIHPYYAVGIVIGDKTIEVRTWNTDYRGDLLIVSTAKKISGLIPGHALGVVTLENVRPMTKSNKDLRAAVMKASDYHFGQYAWELSNPRIIKPIPLKGKLSLWNYDGEIEYANLPPQEDDWDKWNEELTKLWADYII